MLKNLVINEKMPNFATATKTMVSHPVGANGNRSLSKVGYFNGQSTTSGVITTIAAAVQKEDCSNRGSVVFVATGRAAVPFSNRLSIKTKVMKKETEIWKDVEGTDGQYQVSNLGRVRSVYYRINGVKKPRIKMLTLYLPPGWKYYKVGVKSPITGGNSTLVHQLVAYAFVPGYKPGMTVNHKDENTFNNRASNLEWISRADNMRYSRCYSVIASRGEIQKEAVAFKRIKSYVASLPGEEWKDVVGFEGRYQVSNMGRVKSFCQNRIQLIKPRKNCHGRFMVTFIKDNTRFTYTVHRLVAIAFVDGYRPELTVNHKDEDITNNKADNLEWCTQEYNNTYGTRMKRIKQKNSIPVLQYTIDGKFVAEYESMTAADLALSGKNSGNIRFQMKHGTGIAYGYKWKFKRKKK